MPYAKSKTFTIASGQTTSAAVDLGEGALIGCAVGCPAALTGANLSVTAAPTSTGTFGALYADSAAVSIAISANRVVAFGGAEMDALSSVQHVKFVSDAAEGAERTFTLYLRYQ